MRFVMNPDMVNYYPIWGVGLVLVGAAVFGALLLELCAWRLLPIELRQRHNDVAAAIFSVIGVTYAVLLAFVAKLAWEGFDRAKAASYTEAMLIGDVYNLSAGFADPEKSSIRNDIFGYARRVVTAEWPAQAEGLMVDQDSIYLNGLNKIAVTLHPSGHANGGLPSLLLQTIERLWDARQERLPAAQPTIPGIVVRDDRRGGSDGRFRFVPWRAEPADEARDVGCAGRLRRPGADTDYCPQQPIPRRFPGLERASSRCCRRWKPRRDNNNSKRAWERIIRISLRARKDHSAPNAPNGSSQESKA